MIPIRRTTAHKKKVLRAFEISQAGERLGAQRQEQASQSPKTPPVQLRLPLTARPRKTPLTPTAPESKPKNPHLAYWKRGRTKYK